jgi:hypothetical protein
MKYEATAINSNDQTAPSRETTPRSTNYGWRTDHRIRLSALAAALKSASPRNPSRSSSCFRFESLDRHHACLNVMVMDGLILLSYS